MSPGQVRCRGRRRRRPAHRPAVPRRHPGAARRPRAGRSVSTTSPGRSSEQCPQADAGGRPPGSAPRPGGGAVITRSTKLKLLAFAARRGRSAWPTWASTTSAWTAPLLGGGYEVAADFERLRRHLRQRRGDLPRRRRRPGHATCSSSTTASAWSCASTRTPTRSRPTPTAVVATRSAVGEQYVILRPDRRGRALPGGRRRSSRRSAPSIPVPVEQMLLNLDEFVGSIDQENLRIVIEELGRASRAPGTTWAGSSTTATCSSPGPSESLPQTLRLITDGQTVLDTQTRQPVGDPRSGRRTCGCSPTRSSTMDPDLREHRGQRARRRARRCRPWSRTPARAWARWSATSTSSTGSRSRGWTASEQMLITYPDAVPAASPSSAATRTACCARTSASCSTPATRTPAPPATSRARHARSPGCGRERRHRRRRVPGHQRRRPEPGRRLRRERLQHPGRAEHRPSGGGRRAPGRERPRPAPPARYGDRRRCRRAVGTPARRHPRVNLLGASPFATTTRQTRHDERAGHVPSDDEEIHGA